MREGEKERERRRECVFYILIFDLKKFIIYIEWFFSFFLDISIVDSVIVNEIDSLIGRFFNLSIVECFIFSKVWFILVGWCYKWGRKFVDNVR